MKSEQAMSVLWLKFAYLHDVIIIGTDGDT